MPDPVLRQALSGYSATVGGDLRLTALGGGGGPSTPWTKVNIKGYRYKFWDLGIWKFEKSPI